MSEKKIVNVQFGKCADGQHSQCKKRVESRLSVINCECDCHKSIKSDDVKLVDGIKPVIEKKKRFGATMVTKSSNSERVELPRNNGTRFIFMRCDEDKHESCPKEIESNEGRLYCTCECHTRLALVLRLAEKLTLAEKEEVQVFLNEFTGLI